MPEPFVFKLPELYPLSNPSGSNTHESKRELPDIPVLPASKDPLEFKTFQECVYAGAKGLSPKSREFLVKVFLAASSPNQPYVDDREFFDYQALFDNPQELRAVLNIVLSARLQIVAAVQKESEVNQLKFIHETEKRLEFMGRLLHALGGALYIDPSVTTERCEILKGFCDDSYRHSYNIVEGLFSSHYLEEMACFDSYFQKNKHRREKINSILQLWLVRRAQPALPAERDMAVSLFDSIVYIKHHADILLCAYGNESSIEVLGGQQACADLLMLSEVLASKGCTQSEKHLTELHKKILEEGSNLLKSLGPLLPENAKRQRYKAILMMLTQMLQGVDLKYIAPKEAFATVSVDLLKITDINTDVDNRSLIVIGNSICWLTYSFRVGYDRYLTCVKTCQEVVSHLIKIFSSKKNESVLSFKIVERLKEHARLLEFHAVRLDLEGPPKKQTEKDQKAEEALKRTITELEDRVKRLEKQRQFHQDQDRCRTKQLQESQEKNQALQDRMITLGLELATSEARVAQLRAALESVLQDKAKEIKILEKNITDLEKSITALESRAAERNRVLQQAVEQQEKDLTQANTALRAENEQLKASVAKQQGCLGEFQKYALKVQNLQETQKRYTLELEGLLEKARQEPDQAQTQQIDVLSAHLSQLQLELGILVGENQRKEYQVQAITTVAVAQAQAMQAQANAAAYHAQFPPQVQVPPVTQGQVTQEASPPDQLASHRVNGQRPTTVRRKGK